MHIRNTSHSTILATSIATLVCLSVLLFTTSKAGFADDSKPKSVFRTATVQRGNITATVSATGTLEPEEVIDVGAQVSGVIASFGPDRGDKDKTVDYCSVVKKGDILAQIDPARYELGVDHAKAGLVVAQAELKRAAVRSRQAEKDWERGKEMKITLTQEDLDTRKAAFDGAKAEEEARKAAVQQAEVALKQAEIDLRYCTITAPADGVIIDRRVNLGQTVVSNLQASSLFLLAKGPEEIAGLGFGERGRHRSHQERPVR